MKKIYIEREQINQQLSERTFLAEETMILNALRQDHFLPVGVKIIIG